MLVGFILYYLPSLRQNCSLNDESLYNCLLGICIYCCIFLYIEKNNQGIGAVVAHSAVCYTRFHSKTVDSFLNCDFVNKADNFFCHIRFSTWMYSLIEKNFVMSAGHIFARFGMLVY